MHSNEDISDNCLKPSEPIAKKKIAKQKRFSLLRLKKDIRRYPVNENTLATSVVVNII